MTINPQLKSVLTSLLLAFATAATTWGVAHGLVPAADQNVITNDIVTALFAGAGIVLTAYKTRMVSPAAAITQVNAQDNGVKVVAATAQAPIVTVPLR